MTQTAHEPKNFITANAVENILSVPKAEAEPVDWMKKASYGKVRRQRTPATSPPTSSPARPPAHRPAHQSARRQPVRRSLASALRLRAGASLWVPTPAVSRRCRRTLGPRPAGVVGAQVPPYLQKIKKEISEEYEHIRAMQQQQVAPSAAPCPGRAPRRGAADPNLHSLQEDDMPAGMRQLGEDERLELIDALKAKWDEARHPT